MATAAATTPTTPMTTAMTTGTRLEISSTRGVALALSGAPSPAARPYGNAVASTTIAQRPTVGATTSSCARVRPGSASRAVTLSRSTEANPITPKAPTCGSRMISSLRSGVACTNTASHVSIKPSACRPPVIRSNAAIKIAQSSRDGTPIHRSAASISASTTPRPSPTTGIQTRPDPSAYSPRERTGKRVRNWIAASNPPTLRRGGDQAWLFAWKQDANAVAPVLQQVGHGLLEGDRRFPTRGSFELIDVGPQQADVAGSHARRILLHRDPRRGVAEQDVQHVADSHAAATADVVDLTGCAALGRQPVGAHHVTCVGPVPLGIEIAAL